MKRVVTLTTKTRLVRVRPRMRIALVADCLDTTRAGGVVSAHRFAEHLRRDNDVTVIGTAAKGFPCIVMRPVSLPSKRYSEMGFIFAIPNRRAIARELANADIVHLQFPFWLSFVALTEAKRLGKPIVAAMHVQPENLLYNIGLHNRYLARKMYDLTVAHLYNHVDAVICPTEFAAEKLRAHGLTTATHVISNGYSAHAEQGVFERAASDAGFFLIASIGRYAWDKRQDVLIDAVRRCRYRGRIKLVIAGAGPREAALRARAKGSPNAPEFGYLSEARMNQVLNTADLFVHCGEVELEGMSVLDAMSVGLPTLIADSSESAASRLALDARFLFPAGDAQALAERIDMWIENEAGLNATRAATRNIARQFEFTKNADKLTALFQTVVDGASAEAA